MPVFHSFLIISTLSIVLIGFMPGLILPLAILWGATLVAAGVYLHKKKLLLLYLINIITLFGLGVLGGAVVLQALQFLLLEMTFFGAAAMVMGWLANRGQDYYQVQKWGMLVAVIGVSLFLGIVYLGSGQIGTGEMERQLNQAYEETLEIYEESGALEKYEERGFSREDLDKSFQHFSQLIIRNLPAIFYLQAILAVFFMLLLGAFWSKRSGTSRLIRKPYSEEVMPWQLVWVFIFGLALCLGGKDRLLWVYYSGTNLLVVMTVISMYYGVAAVIYQLRRSWESTRKWLGAALIILSVVFIPSAVIFFSVMGLFDALLDYRRLRIQKEE